MWRPPEEPWQYRILAVLPSSIDDSQLAIDLRLTPTERVEKMCRLLEAAEALRAAMTAATAPARR